MADPTPADLQAELAAMRKAQATTIKALAVATRPVVEEVQDILTSMTDQLTQLRGLRALLGGGAEPNSPGQALYMGLDNVDTILTNVRATATTVISRLDQDIATADSILAA